jgi:signal transduction histidine kinase
MSSQVFAYSPRSPRELCQSAASVLGFSTLIAVLTYRLVPKDGFIAHWTLAMTIGACYWLANVGLTWLPDALKPLAGQPWLGPRGRRWLGLMASANVAAGVLGTWLGGQISGLDLWSGSQQARAGLAVVILTGVVGTQLMVARGRARALRLQLIEVERDAAQAHLRLLQAQLEPHMLFNTLANLRALVRLDPARAEQMIDHLNRFLRASLSASQRDMHPLADELARIGDYLALMQVRMGDRLKVAIDVPEALRALPVPALLLQPLVENAIHHGLEPLVQGGTITLSAQLSGEQLTLSVCDDGAGLTEHVPLCRAPATQAGLHAGGLGLSHVHQRLLHQYGKHARLTLVARVPQGACAQVQLPLAPHSPQPSPHHADCPDR